MIGRTYEDFLADKSQVAGDHGFIPGSLPGYLYQRVGSALCQMIPLDRFDGVASESVSVANAAQSRYGDFASMHEAYGVLAEEVAEFLEAVRLRQDDPRRPHSCRAEAIDIAAVALRIAEQSGRVLR